jgi:chemotaxis protein CheD
LKKIHIGIGELYAASEPTIISTILGSCVAVCLDDRVSRVGGMNHILLPGDADLKRFNDSARYGINAMELLVNRMLTTGADRHKLRAKVFGGGHILSTPGEEDLFNPGRDNARFVFDFLETEKIPVDGYNVGGSFGRKVYLNTSTGDVFLKKIGKYSVDDLRHQEEKYSRFLRGEVTRSGEVAIF